MATASYLCPLCLEMTRACIKAHPDKGWITSDQQSFEVFRQAAAQGCFICSGIWNRNDRRHIDWSNLDLKTWLPMGYMEHRPARRENERLFQLTVRYKEREDSGEEGPRFIGMRFCMIPCDGKYRFMPIGICDSLAVLKICQIGITGRCFHLMSCPLAPHRP